MIYIAFSVLSFVLLFFVISVGIIINRGFKKSDKYFEDYLIRRETQKQN